MGYTGYTGQVRVGMTGCEATERESDSSLRCLVGLSSLGTRRVMMTVGKRASTVTQDSNDHHTGTRGWSGDREGMSAMRKMNAGSTGSMSVTIQEGLVGLASYTGRGGLSRFS
eukprot:1268425-Rhodomonas_salina.1